MIHTFHVNSVAQYKNGVCHILSHDLWPCRGHIRSKGPLSKELQCIERPLTSLHKPWKMSISYFYLQNASASNFVVRLQGVREKIVQRKSALMQIKRNCEWNIYQCHKWSLGFWMPFISAYLDVAIRIYRHFPKRSQGTNCATFRWMGQNNAQLLIGAYQSCWLEWIHSSHNIQ